MNSRRTRSEAEALKILNRMVENKEIVFCTKTVDFEPIADIVIVTNNLKTILLELKESTAEDFIGIMKKVIDKPKQYTFNKNYDIHCYILALYKVSRFFYVPKIEQLLNSSTIIPPKVLGNASEFIGDDMESTIRYVIGVYNAR